MNTDQSNTNSVPSELPETPAVPAVIHSLEQFSDPKVREKLRAELRAEEWAMHCELMGAARTILKTLFDNPRKDTVADVARILDLSSKLGRLATESNAGPQDAGVDTTVLMVEWKAALQRVYTRRKIESKPLPPGAVVDVNTVNAEAASLSASTGERD